MTDCVLIQDNRAHEIWRGKTKDQLPPFAPALVAAIVEVADNTVNVGDTWNGTQFTPGPVPPVVVDYAKFRGQWTDAEKQALHSAASTSWQIDDFVGLARAQNAVNITGDVGTSAKAALVAANVLTQDRADILFNPTTWQ